jgi:hypothetical protein
MSEIDNILMWKDDRDIFIEEASCEKNMYSMVFVVRNDVQIQRCTRKKTGHANKGFCFYFSLPIMNFLLLMG